MTYRDRRAARADRLREWSAKRIDRATATLASDNAQPFAHDIAFLTQPGRIPERTRMNARADRAYGSLAKADSMAARADSIDAAAERAIYSDDLDAIARLTERIADLEAERDRITRYNASARKAHKADPAQNVGDLDILSERQRADLVSLARHAAWQMARRQGAFPAYVTANLSGSIGRQRARLAELSGAPRPLPTFRPDHQNVCRHCGEWEANHDRRYDLAGAPLLCLSGWPVIA